MLSPAARERAAAFAAARRDPGRASGLPRELAALQSLLIEALDREIPERDRGEFARAVSRLAEVFGAVQSAAMESLVRERSGEAARRSRDRPCRARPSSTSGCAILLAEHRRTGAPFASPTSRSRASSGSPSGYGEDAA